MPPLRRKRLSHWHSCQQCGLARFRRNVVLGRGTLPADLLLIGEGPGKSEDLLGEAFVGPSGVFLDEMIEEATQWAGLEVSPTYYITNTVGCRPTNKRQGSNRPPTENEILCCAPRVEFTYEICKPQVVLLIGRVAEKHYKKVFDRAIHFEHPAYLLRQGRRSAPGYTIYVRKMADVFMELNRTQSCV